MIAGRGSALIPSFAPTSEVRRVEESVTDDASHSVAVEHAQGCRSAPFGSPFPATRQHPLCPRTHPPSVRRIQQQLVLDSAAPFGGGKQSLPLPWIVGCWVRRGQRGVARTQLKKRGLRGVVSEIVGLLTPTWLCAFGDVGAIVRDVFEDRNGRDGSPETTAASIATAFLERIALCRVRRGPVVG